MIDLLRWLTNFGAILAMWLTVARYTRYWHRGEGVPRLLVRDTIFMAAFGLTYIAVAFTKFSTGSSPFDAVSEPWLFFSRAAYSVAFWTYIYFELRMVD